MKTEIAKFDNLISGWIKRNNVDMTFEGKGSREVYVNGRSFDEILIEIDDYFDLHRFVLDLYQSFRINPTTTKGNDLKKAMKILSDHCTDVRRLILHLNSQTKKTEGHNNYKYQQVISELFLKKGEESVEKYFKKKGWEFTDTIKITIEGLKRKKLYSGNYTEEKPLRVPKKRRYSGTQNKIKQLKEIKRSR